MLRSPRSCQSFPLGIDKSPFCNKFRSAGGYRRARHFGARGPVDSLFNLFRRPPADDILVNHGVVEVVAYDRLEKRCRKSWARDTLLPGLLLKTNCCVS